MDLDIYTYAVLMRDAFCKKSMMTPEGKEYLEKCYRLTITKPDRKSLREKFGAD